MKPGTSCGRIPANVSDSERAIVIAGFANYVEAINQYAAPIQAATIHGASSARRCPGATRMSGQLRPRGHDCSVPAIETRGSRRSREQVGVDHGLSGNQHVFVAVEAGAGLPWPPEILSTACVHAHISTADPPGDRAVLTRLRVGGRDARAQLPGTIEHGHGGGGGRLLPSRSGQESTLRTTQQGRSLQHLQRRA
jgi:hypothetical protein